jgi:glycosyltransferase involved in cell wall biosynthesis
LENRYINKADEVIVVSPSIEAAYRDRYASKGLRNLTLIRNVPNERMASNEKHPLRDSLRLGSDDFVALYQGALTINRGVETLLAMASRLNGTKIQLVFMGYGILEPLVKEAVSAHENIHFQPAVPYEQVLNYTSDADVGLVSVKPTCLSYLYCLPNKLFESIQAGIPILVNDLPDCVDLVEGYGIGEKVKEDSPDGWLRALEDAAEKKPAWKEQARAGLEAAQKELKWERESQKLMQVYQRVGLPAD